MYLFLQIGLFATTMLGLALYTLAVTGHFPREHRAAALQGTSGAAVLVATIILALVSAALGVAAGWQRLAWFVMIIAGGGAVLLAPLVLAWFSDEFVNGRAALFILSGVAVIAATLLLLS